MTDKMIEEEIELMKIELEDGEILECIVLGVFSVEDKEYIALVPNNEDEEELALIYEYKEDEDGIELINIETDQEYNLVAEVYEDLFFTEEDNEE